MKTNEINWQELLSKIQAKLYLSQSDIARHCDVAKQTVSNWKTGFRNLGYHAKRRLVRLASEGGILDIDKAIGNQTEQNACKRDKKYYILENLYDQLPPDCREEVIDFARFIVNKHNKNKPNF